MLHLHFGGRTLHPARRLSHTHYAPRYSPNVGEEAFSDVEWLRRVGTLSRCGTVTALGWPRSRIGIERLNMSPTWRGIRTPTEKFVMFEGGGREYYNLINDPGELNNTWGSLSQAKKDALVAQANALSNYSGAGCRTSDR